MFRHEKIGLELSERGVQVVTDKYGYILAAKITNEDDYQLLKEYYAAAKSSCYSQIYAKEIDGQYEGTDIYFFEGEPENREGPSTYRLESLTFKKRQFEEFCEKFDFL